jgi:hypothetical protein
MQENSANITDEVFSEIAEELKEVTNDELIDTVGDMQRFLEDDDYRPDKFAENTITGGSGRGFRAYLEYTPDTETLYFCSASVKACPYPLEDMKSTTGSTSDLLYIYGHPSDTKDEFSSRLDKDVVWKFTDDFKTRFRRVRLSGAFANIAEMKSVLFQLYTKLVIPGRDARIELTIDSTVPEDSGKVRTIADLVHDGYLKPGILDNPNIVKLCYSRLSPKFYATLFKGEIKDLKKQLALFDEEEDDTEDNKNEYDISFSSF